MMSTETSAATPVRVPKLAVRNKAGASGGSSNASERTTSSHSSMRAASPRRDRGISDASQRSKPSHMEANARRSGSSQGKQPQQAQSSNASSKKKNGVLGFLTLKEPSTSALEQYAEQQKKIAASKGGRATAASLSSVSIQKLPDHVPKVNSKWDGLPEDARKRLDQKRRSQDTGSLFSTSTRQTYRSANSSSSNSSTSTRRPIGTMSSRPTSMGSTVRGGHKFTVIHPTANYDTTTPIAVYADPHGETSVHPALRPRALSDESPTTMHSADSPAAVRSSAISVRRTSGAIPAELAGRAIAELPGDLPAELPGEEPPQMAGDEPTAYITTPTGGSPLTPPVHDVPEHIPRVVRHGAVVDSQGTTWYSDTDPDATSASASDTDQSVVLPKPFLRRPMMEEIAESPIEYPETPEDWPLPAAARRALEKETREREREREASEPENPPPHAPYDPSSLPDPSPPPTDPLPPTPTFVIPTSIYSTHRQTNRPPSLAPSVASTIDWPLPPSHRLAMATGATPRKADVAPWERFDGRAEAAAEAAAAMGSRSVVSAGAGVGTGGAREREREGKKRFSGILGRK